MKTKLLSPNAALVSLSALCLAACGDPLAHVELIDKTRILAAKVEVTGEPTRAAPLPGEEVTVRWLVVTPEPEPSIAWRFAACVARDSTTDLTACAGEPLAEASSLEPTVGVPTLAFQAPPDALGDERLAVTGAVCRAGAGLATSSGLACSDGSTAQAAVFDFMLDDGQHPNTNPAFTRLTFDGDELGPENADTTDCALLPNVSSGSKGHRLGVELDESSRDALAPGSTGGPTRESLLLSYFITRGELDHAWTAIESDAPTTSGSALWAAPPTKELALARFVFVVRDGRGGADFTERRVCIAP